MIHMSHFSEHGFGLGNDRSFHRPSQAPSLVALRQASAALQRMGRQDRDDARLGPLRHPKSECAGLGLTCRRVVPLEVKGCTLTRWNRWSW